jgi:peptidoglycan/xylan/chitin deacetylase (PgdA/CDA1 family)
MFIVLIFSLLLIWFLLPYVLRIIQVSILRNKCKKNHMIVLTYDDGPTRGVTENILNVLEKYNISATFFVLGKNSDFNPHLLRNVISLGHEIGTHSYSHLNSWKSSPLLVYRDTERGFGKLSEYGGSKLYRPPYGKMTLFSMLHVHLRGYRLAWWTVDSTDTWDSPLSVADVIRKIRNENGGVVLMHDFESSIGPELNNHYLVDLSVGIIEFANAEGYKVCTMGELFKN